MSCMMTNPRELAAISEYAAAILNAERYGRVISGVRSINARPLLKPLADCLTPDGCDYDAEAVFRRLHDLNARAYDGRYPDCAPSEPEPPPPMPSVEIRTDEETIGDWLPRLYWLLRFFCYQCEESATLRDPLLLALYALSDELAHLIAERQARDLGLRWGEW